MQTFSLTKDGLNQLSLSQFLRRMRYMAIYTIVVTLPIWGPMLRRGELEFDGILPILALLLAMLVIAGLDLLVFKRIWLRQMAIEIGEDYLARRDGKRTTFIRVSEIARANIVDEGLKIASIDRVQSIVVPKQIEGYREIESLVRR